MKSIDLYSAIITFNEDCVLTVKFKNNVEVDIDEAVKLVTISLEMVAGQSFYLLVDARDILSSMDHESRKYIAEHQEYNRLNIAQAIVVNNMPIRLLASAYFRFYSHVNPVKLFRDIEEAREWLFTHH